MTEIQLKWTNSMIENFTSSKLCNNNIDLLSLNKKSYLCTMYIPAILPVIIDIIVYVYKHISL